VHGLRGEQARATTGAWSSKACARSRAMRASPRRRRWPASPRPCPTARSALTSCSHPRSAASATAPAPSWCAAGHAACQAVPGTRARCQGLCRLLLSARAVPLRAAECAAHRRPALAHRAAGEGDRAGDRRLLGARRVPAPPDAAPGDAGPGRRHAAGLRVPGAERARRGDGRDRGRARGRQHLHFLPRAQLARGAHHRCAGAQRPRQGLERAAAHACGPCALSGCP
jgi:hypothetical protein